MSLSMIVIISRRVLMQNHTLTRRLAGVSGPQKDVQKGAAKSGGLVSKKLIERFGKHIALPDVNEITRIRFKLAQAGFYDAQAVTIYCGVRVFALLVPQLVLLCAWPIFLQDMETKTLLMISFGLIGAGMFGPDYVLGSKIATRQQLARDGFPDLLDLLISCLEAGLGLDAALSNVAEELGTRFPVLKINLDLLNLELMAGRQRYEAFKNFAERLGLEEAKALTIMLKQSEEMGSSLGLALRTFSEEMRSKRMLLAEEKAMALPAKMTVPLILFIFPTIMTMLLLPAAARLMQSF
ncbi:MAG: pilus assembly protein [Robiginitomaculum sp.]|nr:MAG: pilus assembly protein [Robiginitomaculum sp.]